MKTYVYPLNCSWTIKHSLSNIQVVFSVDKRFMTCPYGSHDEFICKIKYFLMLCDNGITVK